jgi:hypothetical protein
MSILTEMYACQLVTSGKTLTLLRKIHEGVSYHHYQNYKYHRTFKDWIQLLYHSVPFVQSNLLNDRL